MSHQRGTVERNQNKELTSKCGIGYHVSAVVDGDEGDVCRGLHQSSGHQAGRGPVAVRRSVEHFLSLKAKRHRDKFYDSKKKQKRSFSIALRSRASGVEMGAMSAAERAAEISTAAEILGQK